MPPMDLQPVWLFTTSCASWQRSSTGACTLLTFLRHSCRVTISQRAREFLSNLPRAIRSLFANS